MLQRVVVMGASKSSKKWKQFLFCPIQWKISCRGTSQDPSAHRRGNSFLFRLLK